MTNNNIVIIIAIIIYIMGNNKSKNITNERFDELLPFVKNSRNYTIGVLNRNYQKVVSAIDLPIDSLYIRLMLLYVMFNKSRITKILQLYDNSLIINYKHCIVSYTLCDYHGNILSSSHDFCLNIYVLILEHLAKSFNIHAKHIITTISREEYVSRVIENFAGCLVCANKIENTIEKTIDSYSINHFNIKFDQIITDILNE